MFPQSMFYQLFSSFYEISSSVSTVFSTWLCRDRGNLLAFISVLRMKVRALCMLGTYHVIEVLRQPPSFCSMLCMIFFCGRTKNLNNSNNYTRKCYLLYYYDRYSMRRGIIIQLYLICQLKSSLILLFPTFDSDFLTKCFILKEHFWRKFFDLHIGRQGRITYFRAHISTLLGYIVKGKIRIFANRNPLKTNKNNNVES